MNKIQHIRVKKSTRINEFVFEQFEYLIDFLWIQFSILSF